MSSSFHNADKRTHRKVMVVGLLFCAAFVAISFFAKEQPDNNYVLIKADKLVQMNSLVLWGAPRLLSGIDRGITWRIGENHIHQRLNSIPSRACHNPVKPLSCP